MPEIVTEAVVRVTGTGEMMDAVGVAVEHVEQDGGEMQIVQVQFNFYHFTASVNFNIEEAEKFLVHFRDELIRAKRGHLEWKTDTDPATGIDGEKDNA